MEKGMMSILCLGLTSIVSISKSKATNDVEQVSPAIGKKHAAKCLRWINLIS